MKRRDDVAEPTSVEELVPELARRRDVADAHRADELDRRRGQARHERDLADVAEETRHAELQRVEREAQARADADLARMYREARAAGERTRVTSQMARSGEARALRLERLRGLNLKVLIPVLSGFAAWSTTGVHDGAARLMGITSWGSAMWWALWLLEPVLISAVVWVIITRARLAASGGRLRAEAGHIAVGCLSTSVLLNLAGAAHTVGGFAELCAVLGAMAAHAIGPLGAAVTAHLIGIVDESIAEADPWTEDGRPVPLLAEMDLSLPAPKTAAGRDAETASEGAVEAPTTVWPLTLGERTPLPIVSAAESTLDSADDSAAAVAWPLSLGGRTALPVIARPATSGSARRTTTDQGERQGSEAAATARPKRSQTRPNKGVPVPAAARKSAAKTSPRAMSDADLRERLDALVAAGELAADASARAVQSALGIGFDRAKRVLSMTANEPMPGQLTVLDDVDGERQDDEAA